MSSQPHNKMMLFVAILISLAPLVATCWMLFGGNEPISITTPSHGTSLFFDITCCGSVATCTSSLSGTYGTEQSCLDAAAVSGICSATIQCNLENGFPNGTCGPIPCGQPSNKWQIFSNGECNTYTNGICQSLADKLMIYCNHTTGECSNCTPGSNCTGLPGLAGLNTCLGSCADKYYYSCNTDGTCNDEQQVVSGNKECNSFGQACCVCGELNDNSQMCTKPIESNTCYNVQNRTCEPSLPGGTCAGKTAPYSTLSVCVEDNCTQYGGACNQPGTPPDTAICYESHCSTCDTSKGVMTTGCLDTASPSDGSVCNTTTSKCECQYTSSAYTYYSDVGNKVPCPTSNTTCENCVAVYTGPPPGSPSCPYVPLNITDVPAEGVVTYFSPSCVNTQNISASDIMLCAADNSPCTIGLPLAGTAGFDSTLYACVNNPTGKCTQASVLYPSSTWEQYVQSVYYNDATSAVTTGVCDSTFTCSGLQKNTQCADC